jgi:two-component system response regulator FixJ
MTIDNEQHIFFVDDEPKVRKAVGETLRGICPQVSCFASAEDCLRQLASQRCHLLITDLKMPEMDGLELLIRAKRLAPWMPVLIITAYGDIEKAVKAIKAGAEDFIQKPLVTGPFLRKVQSLLQQYSMINSFLTGKALTRMEYTVLKYVVEGKTSKEIANLLNRSIRTIGCHRAHIMAKLGADNIVDLINQIITMRLAEPPEQQDQAETECKDKSSEIRLRA